MEAASQLVRANGKSHKLALQLPLKRLQMPFDGDHAALDSGTLARAGSRSLQKEQSIACECAHAMLQCEGH